MAERAPSRKSVTSRWVTAAVVVTILFSAYSLFTVLTLKPGQSAVIPPGVTVSRDPVEVKSVAVNADGDLIVTYSNGSITNAGQVRGTDGTTPSAEIIQAAVNRYCSSNVCEGNPPTQSTVLAAVMQYCSGGICRGDKGDTGDSPILTADQILAQVNTYCAANGNCRGATGETGATGAAGTNARQPVWACVLTTENNTDVRYYSQKYMDEPDTAYLTWEYRSRLPSWFVPNSCIDMRAA